MAFKSISNLTEATVLSTGDLLALVNQTETKKETLKDISEFMRTDPSLPKHVSGSMNVSGNICVSGGIHIDEGLNVSGNVNLSSGNVIHSLGPLNHSGTIFQTGDVSIQGNLTMSGSSTITADIGTFNGVLTANAGLESSSITNAGIITSPYKATLGDIDGQGGFTGDHIYTTASGRNEISGELSLGASLLLNTGEIILQGGAGNISTNGDIYVYSGTVQTNNLTVTGSTSLQGAFSTSGTLESAGIISGHSGAYISGTLTAEDLVITDSHIASTIAATGISTSKDILVSGSLASVNDISLAGNLKVSGQTYLGNAAEDAIYMTGNVHTRNNVYIGGRTEISGGIHWDQGGTGNNLVISETLDSNLIIATGVTIHGALTATTTNVYFTQFTGTTCYFDYAYINNSLGALVSSGKVYLYNELNVLGTTTNLFSGYTSFANGLTVTGDTRYRGGVSYFYGDVSFNTGVEFAQGFTVDGSDLIEITSDLTKIYGPLVIQGAGINVNGNITGTSQVFGNNFYASDSIYADTLIQSSGEIECDTLTATGSTTLGTAFGSETVTLYGTTTAWGGIKSTAGITGTSIIKTNSYFTGVQGIYLGGPISQLSLTLTPNVFQSHSAFHNGIAVTGDSYISTLNVGDAQFSNNVYISGSVIITGGLTVKENSTFESAIVGTLTLGDHLVNATVFKNISWAGAIIADDGFDGAFGGGIGTTGPITGKTLHTTSSLTAVGDANLENNAYIANDLYVTGNLYVSGTGIISKPVEKPTVWNTETYNLFAAGFGTYHWTHPFSGYVSSGYPLDVKFYLKCTGAGEHGYTSGDMIDMTSLYKYQLGLTMGWDSTGYFLYFDSDLANPLHGVSKYGGTSLVTFDTWAAGGLWQIVGICKMDDSKILNII